MEESIDEYLNIEYLKENGVVLFKTDVLPTSLTIYLKDEDKKTVEEYIRTKIKNKDTDINYRQYRNKTYSQDVDFVIKYEWETLLNFIEKHPQHKELLK